MHKSTIPPEAKDDRHMLKEIVLSEGPEKVQSGGVWELKFDKNQIHQDILTQKNHRIAGVRNGRAPVVTTGQKSLQRQEGVFIRIN